MNIFNRNFKKKYENSKLLKGFSMILFIKILKVRNFLNN